MFVERPNCPACGASKCEEYYRGAYTSDPIKGYLQRYYGLDHATIGGVFAETAADHDYVLMQCPDCTLLFQKYAPDDALARIVYSEWISAERPGRPPFSFDGAKHYISEALKLTALARRIGIFRNAVPRALDYGMGRGGFALALKACGWEVFGFDFSDDRQELGERSGITMLGKDGLGEFQFGFINSEQVFEHLPDPLDTARRLTAALAPGGLFKISVPFNRWVENGDFRIDWHGPRYGKHSPMPLAPLEHLQYYKRPSLEKLGERLDLRRVKLSAQDHLKYSLEWGSPRATAKNIGRIFAFDRFRNYYLFAKPR